MAIIFPPPGGQTPLNTFSPTSTPFDTSTTSNLTYIWDPALGVWTSSAGGGGGGGVASIAVTAPITDTGTASVPDIGIAPATTTTAGSLSAADKTKIDALPATIVAAVTGTAPIVIAGTASNPDVTIQLASAAEAAAGTNATKVLTPATGVPKTPADMTGALYLPGGNDGARPGTTTGMLRYNNTGGTPVAVEYYDGANWTKLATAGLGGEVLATIQWVGPTSTGGYVAPTTLTGKNVASASLAPGNYTRITFTNPLPSTDYSISCCGNLTVVRILAQTTAYFDFNTRDTANQDIWGGNLYFIVAG